MTDKELISNVHNSMYHQIQKSGFAAPVQVLMDMSILSKEDYEQWRFGKVDYLERVCRVNLSKLSAVMREIRSYGTKNQLKASWTFYKQWGQKNLTHAKKLRFSKSGNEDIEKTYATHYISSAKTTTTES
jgi:hypothetical protein